MATRYLYNNVYYNNLWSLRKAIFIQEKIKFGNVTTQQQFDALGLTVTVDTYDPIDQTDLQTLKQQLLTRLETSFNDYRNSKYTYINSSLGFKANANVTAFNNIEGMIVQLELDSVNPNPTITFMDFDDIPRDLNKTQLQTLLLEISQNGSNAYAKKWQYRTIIEQTDDYGHLTSLEPFIFSSL